MSSGESRNHIVCCFLFAEVLEKSLFDEEGMKLLYITHAKEANCDLVCIPIKTLAGRLGLEIKQHEYETNIRYS